MIKCIHNDRTRFTNGFHCHDCGTFFEKDTPTYRSDELLSKIWMVLHNINADRMRKNKKRIVEVDSMRDKIGIGKSHDNYEELIAEAEIITAAHGKNSKSATLVLRG